MTFTNIVYTEFDTTQQTMVKDIRDAILTSASWSKINPTAALLATTANANAGATTLTFSSGAPAAAGLVVGSIIRIGADGAADCEYRTVTAIAATTVTVAALTYAHSSGTNIYDGHEILKATTTRGADMIVDLMDTHVTVTTSKLNLRTWFGHDGSVGDSGVQRFLYWRNNAGVAAAVVHCVLSVSKEHIFLSLEGPRAFEPNTPNATYGSHRNVFFMSDIVPYFGSDLTPCVYSGGSSTDSVNWNAQNLFGNVSKNRPGTMKQVSAPLATLGFPVANSATPHIQLQRIAEADGKFYLFPYVVIESDMGMRGRLAAFWFAGFTYVDTHDLSGIADPQSPALNTRLTYAGQEYILLAAHRGGSGASDYAGSSFGYQPNAQGSLWQTPVIAVPYA